jgi:hypothetical protein
VSNTSRSTVVRFLYTAESFLHRRSNGASDIANAALLHFRHVPEALTTSSTDLTCEKILRITSTGNASIPCGRTCPFYFPHLSLSSSSSSSSGFRIVRLFQEQGSEIRKGAACSPKVSGEHNVRHPVLSGDNTSNLRGSLLYIIFSYLFLKFMVDMFQKHITILSCVYYI